MKRSRYLAIGNSLGGIGSGLGRTVSNWDRSSSRLLDAIGSSRFSLVRLTGLSGCPDGHRSVELRELITRQRSPRTGRPPQAGAQPATTYGPSSALVESPSSLIELNILLESGNQSEQAHTLLSDRRGECPNLVTPRFVESGVGLDLGANGELSQPASPHTTINNQSINYNNHSPSLKPRSNLIFTDPLPARALVVYGDWRVAVPTWAELGPGSVVHHSSQERVEGAHPAGDRGRAPAEQVQPAGSTAAGCRVGR